MTSKAWMKYFPLLFSLVQVRNQLGTPGGRRVFWVGPKFYIDSMYENNGMLTVGLYNTFFQGGKNPPLSE